MKQTKVSYPTTTIVKSTIFHGSLRYVLYPNKKPIETILMHASPKKM